MKMKHIFFWSFIFIYKDITDGRSWNTHSPYMLQMIKQGLSASSLLNRGVELMGENNRYEKYFTFGVIILLT